MSSNIADLDGVVLNRAVALALGARFVRTPESQSWRLFWPAEVLNRDKVWTDDAPDYQGDPSLSMPIIMRELHTWRTIEGVHVFTKRTLKGSAMGAGPTMILAGLRCLVAARFSNEELARSLPRDLQVEDEQPTGPVPLESGDQSTDRAGYLR